MGVVLAALIPGVAVQTLIFGQGTLIHICVAMLTGAVVEIAVSYPRAGRAKTSEPSFQSNPGQSNPGRSDPGQFKPGQSNLDGVLDGSAALTAVLIAIAIPAAAPWWVSVVATTFGLVVAKHLYGGLGHNLFNPAMAGYAFVLICFPLEMTRWYSDPIWPALSSPGAVHPFALTFTVDGVTGATPLDAYRANRVRSAASVAFDYVPGMAIYALAGAYALGGCALVSRRIIHWRMPVALLGTVVVCASLFHWESPQALALVAFHLLTGSAVIAAFFVVTDPVTAPMAPGAQWCFAITVGVATFAIRAWGGYADGVAFATLFANMLTPALDRWTPVGAGKTPPNV